MELNRGESIVTLKNSGVESQQLLFPENSSSQRLTITRVTMAAGVINPRHTHQSSEQVWVALEGGGTLLLADGKSAEFSAGDVVRFHDGEVHGFHNTGAVPFVYLSVTSPPVSFRAAYSADWSGAVAQSRDEPVK